MKKSTPEVINNDTICAIATPAGSGAISIIRISGPESFSVCNRIFKPKRKNVDFLNAESHTIHLGDIATNATIIDEVLVSIFQETQFIYG
jgi:tRNA modification GTPase